MIPGGEPYFLESRRLGWRWWRASDLQLAMSLWGDHEVTRLFDARGPLDPTAVVGRLRRELAWGRQHGVQYWPMFLRDGGALVGCCGLCPHDPATGRMEFGIHLRPAYWGQGLGTEAGSAVIAHAFGPLGVPELFAGHHPENEGSRRLLLKLGFVYSHEEYFPPTGRDHLCYLLPGP